MSIYFCFSLLLLLANACVNNKFQCSFIKTQERCESINNNNFQCVWNTWNKECNLGRANCIQLQTQIECSKANNCYWNNDTCQIYIRNNNNEQNVQQSINKCSQVTDIKQCRNSYFLNTIYPERCQVVINGKASSIEKVHFPITHIFEDFQCRPADCKFHIYDDCPNFKNGRRCFTYYNECTQCSYFENQQSCIATGECTWNNNTCRNIMCTDLNSKTLCNQRPFCQYIENSNSCSNKVESPFQCYALDINSQPYRPSRRLEEI